MKIKYIIIIVLLILCSSLGGLGLWHSKALNDISEPSKHKEENLFRIYASKKNNNGRTFYDYIITKDKEMLGLNIDLDYKELKRYEVKNQEITKYDFRDFADELMNTSHTKVSSLNGKQVEKVIEILNNENYNFNLLNEIEGEYFIVDYSKNKASSGRLLIDNGKINILIEILSNSNNSMDLDKYLEMTSKKNNYKQYIKDKDYQEIDVNSELIKSLSEFIHTRTTSALDNYKEEKMSNDTMITLTLNQLYKDDQIENCNSEKYLDEYIGGSCEFKMTVFDSYFKKYFDNDLKYNLKEYSGWENGCMYFEPENDKIKLRWTTGCGLEKDVIVEPLYSYETDDKLVIIESTMYLYSRYADINDGTTPGLYNNINDMIYITEENNDIDLKNYENYVTYYSHTFKKGINGKYYYSSFERLN